MAGIPNPGEVGAGVGDALGGIIGDLLARGDYEAAERLMLEASKSFEGIALPGQVQQTGQSAFGNMPAQDAELRNAQLTALRRMQQMGLEGGMDAESRAALHEGRQEAGQYEQQQRGALMANAASRGMLGSNMAYGSALQAQQSGADRLSSAGVQAAGDARRRALMALQGSADIGRAMSSDDYQRQRDRAMALDAVDRFNTQLRSQFDQNRFANQMNLQGARYGAKMGEADVYEKRGARTSDRWRGYGRAAGYGVGMGVGAGTGGA